MLVCLLNSAGSLGNKAISTMGGAMGLIFVPQWTNFNLSVTALQVLGLAGCVGELQGNNAGHSETISGGERRDCKDDLSLMT